MGSTPHRTSSNRPNGDPPSPSHVLGGCYLIISYNPKPPTAQLLVYVTDPPPAQSCIEMTRVDKLRAWTGICRTLPGCPFLLLHQGSRPVPTAGGARPARQPAMGVLLRRGPGPLAGSGGGPGRRRVPRRRRDRPGRLVIPACDSGLLAVLGPLLVGKSANRIPAFLKRITGSARGRPRIPRPALHSGPQRSKTAEHRHEPQRRGPAGAAGGGQRCWPGTVARPGAGASRARTSWPSARDLLVPDGLPPADPGPPRACGASTRSSPPCRGSRSRRSTASLPRLSCRAGAGGGRSRLPPG